jgi:membrane protein DedA with SNARE-associated domain
MDWYSRMTEPLETGRKLPRHWEYAVGILALTLVAGLGVLIARNWHNPEQVAGYGLIGGFVLSILGGATVPIPIPAVAVYAALGGLVTPWFGPAALGPALVGFVCGLGEAFGSLSTYATGYSGAAVLKRRETGTGSSRFGRLYRWLMGMMLRRGGWVLFGVSALINPFFYPVSLAAGASRFGVKRYFFICLAGKVVKCTVVAYIGYLGLRSLLEALGG